MLERLTAQLNFQGEALGLRARRQEVLASNIANADTPNYKARDFDFAGALRQATGAGAPRGAVPVRTRLPMTPVGGAPGRSGAPGAPGAPATVPLGYRQPQQVSIDGNTVDLDRERANFADNSLRYEATLRFINGSVRNLLSAIRGD
ncbi:MAG TPA: flagellar basal body protein [Burkholderiaceae bacterium]|nr:flagellar basal body protein [Burkholderiaceae bacterium]HMM51037.1 flagellar basal body protein [Burkholderiaceae bacterium]